MYTQKQIQVVLFILLIFVIISSIAWGHSSKQRGELKNCVALLDAIGNLYPATVGGILFSHAEVVSKVVKKSLKSSDSYSIIIDDGGYPDGKFFYNAIGSTRCAVIIVSVNFGDFMDDVIALGKPIELLEGQKIVIPVGNRNHAVNNKRNFDLLKKEDLIIVAGLDVKRSGTSYSSGSLPCPELENDYKCVYQPGVTFIDKHEIVSKNREWHAVIKKIPIRGSSVAAPIEAARLVNEMFPVSLPLKVSRNL